MSSLTAKEAFDDMAAHVRDAWEADPLTTGKDIFYQNVRAEPDPDGDAQYNPQPYMALWIRHNLGTQATLADSSGATKHRRIGLVTAQIFCPAGMGMACLNYAEVVGKSLEAKTTSGGVWFRNVGYNDVGPDGDWYQINVTATFEYYQLR